MLVSQVGYGWYWQSAGLVPSQIKREVLAHVLTPRSKRVAVVLRLSIELAVLTLSGHARRLVELRVEGVGRRRVASPRGGVRAGPRLLREQRRRAAPPDTARDEEAVHTVPGTPAEPNRLRPRAAALVKGERHAHLVAAHAPVFTQACACPQIWLSHGRFPNHSREKDDDTKRLIAVLSINDMESRLSSLPVLFLCRKRTFKLKL